MRINQASYNSSNQYAAPAAKSESSDKTTQKTHQRKHQHKYAQQAQDSNTTSQLIALLQELLKLLQGSSSSNAKQPTPKPPSNIAVGEPNGSSNIPAGKGTSATNANNAAGSNSGVKLGVPAYNDPGDGQSFWKQIQNAKPGSVFIMNPNSGPGDKQDPNYKAAIEAAHAKGVKIYGYVSTQYGKRSSDDVQQDIDAYKQMYGVDGIFLDEAQLDKSHLSYYKNISDGLHNDGLEVSANPGQPDIDPAAVDFTDHIMNFEGSYSDYQKAQFPEWTKNVSPDKFWNVIYDTPSDVNFQDLLNTAAKNHAGLIYATDDGGDNPWDNTASFFADELRLTA